MGIFNHIFKKDKIKENNEDFKKFQEIDDNKINSNYSNKYQAINAENIKNSTIIQNIVEGSDSALVIDEKISEELELIKKSRFFNEFDCITASLMLANRLVRGELSNGSDNVKSRTLAWCARLLSIKELDKAEEYLKLAKEYGKCTEIKVAEAFISSEKGNEEIALNTISNINSSLSRSAAIMIVANREGAQNAIDWFMNVGFSVSDLDSDGKHFLITLYFQLGKWELAQSCLEELSDEDFYQTPALNYIVAIMYLIKAVPCEFISGVINQVPFEAATFPLAADGDAMNARQEAHRYFINAKDIAIKLNCDEMAKIFDEYILWLELRDPNESECGKQKLEAKLKNSKSALYLVRLGLQFGIKLDLEAVDQEIERQVALKGIITNEVAIARFTLALTKEKPEEIANYIENYHRELIPYFNEKLLLSLQIEMFSRSGKTEKAKECLNILLKDGISVDEEKRLRGIISEIGGTNSIEIMKEQYKKTSSLSNLLMLVDELKVKCEWNELCKYGEILFERTHSFEAAEIFSKALSNTHNYKRLVEFFKINSILLTQSQDLQMLYCWSLYYEGDLIEARSELSKLSNISDNPNYRALQINLQIAIGDWNSLITFIANESLNKHTRSAAELISTAQLALQLNLPSAKELIYAAAEKGKKDPSILAAAYFLATNAGWEEELDAYQWLNRAAELSGKDGPIRKMSIKDILNFRPNWQKQESEIWEALSRGEIPMFLAADSTNRSLIHMMIFPALTNLTENDIRRKGMVYAYSGCRQVIPLRIGGAIAIDVSALLTLSFLNLFDIVLKAFSIVYISHDTLAWLFEEKHKVAFHQPSRFRIAHKIQNLLATGVMEKLKSDIVPDSELSSQVGDELALLIAEAEKMNCNDVQCIVVCSYPVHRIASFMEEEADLTIHSKVLSSCQAIVEKLRLKGMITVDEMKKARDYFKLQEKPWPNQPEVSDGATLYLDDLTITHFLNIGILKKLKNAGFRLIASPKEVSMANELISYEGISDEINEIVERIRHNVNFGIESGKIKVGRKTNFIETKTQRQSISSHPTSELFELVEHCEAMIVDDRYFNQHTYIEYSSKRKMIFSTIDLLDALVNSGCISSEERFEHRTTLRQAGYCFVPVSNEEILYHLESSEINKDDIIENAELKSIREDILHVRMGSCLQLPKEEIWLNTLIKAFVKALHELWRNDGELSKIIICSNWIINQIDIRGWAHCYNGDVGNNIIKNGVKQYVVLLLSISADMSRKNRNEYWRWLDDIIITPIKEEDSAIYSSIVDYYRKILADILSENF